MKIVFFTVYCGEDHMFTPILPSPSRTYPCYYFTDNQYVFTECKKFGWIPILMDGEPSNDRVESSMKSKSVKVCPHLFEQLEGFDYHIYLDSKITISEKECVDFCKVMDMEEKNCFALSRGKDRNIWEEFHASMKQPRYRRQKQQILKYMYEELKSKKAEHKRTGTGFIIRKCGKECSNLNDAWMTHIQRCGIRCQISFHFLSQEFDKFICTSRVGIRIRKAPK